MISGYYTIHSPDLMVGLFLHSAPLHLSRVFPRERSSGASVAGFGASDVTLG
jgi:hypothetical protein